MTEPTRLIVRLGCALGIHDMPKWGEAEKGSVTIYGTLMDGVFVQRRTCNACGARKVRVAV